MKLFGENFKKTLFFIFLAETFSFCAYVFPSTNIYIFILLSVIILYFTIKNLELGVYIALAEIFIGSKGHLFHFDFNGQVISVRMIIWLILMTVWFFKYFKYFLNTKLLFLYLNKIKKFNILFILFLFIIYGFLNGAINNDFNLVFSDFNAWLYFTLFFPFYATLKSDREYSIIVQVLTASVLWISLETLILLYSFSHNLNLFIYEIYRWLRVTGVAEITLVKGSFYRIFLQSQIFVLIYIFFLLLYLEKKKYQFFKINDNLLFLFLTICISSILASFSRSYWVGILVGFVFYIITQLFYYKIYLKIIIGIILKCFLSICLSLLIIISIVKFPFPSTKQYFNATDLFIERASQISNEAGASSRWSLISPLLSKINTSILFGKGFGSIVTYKTSDPRILQSDPNGNYTTYAFEWGWLDIWLKIGFFGMIAYVILIICIIFNFFKYSEKNNKIIIFGITIGLVAISSTHFFSPYLNHPLGICYLLLASIMIIKK